MFTREICYDSIIWTDLAPFSGNFDYVDSVNPTEQIAHWRWFCSNYSSKFPERISIRITYVHECEYILFLNHFFFFVLTDTIRINKCLYIITSIVVRRVWFQIYPYRKRDWISVKVNYQFEVNFSCKYAIIYMVIDRYRILTYAHIFKLRNNNTVLK